jgi:hypothetical protein
MYHRKFAVSCLNWTLLLIYLIELISHFVDDLRMAVKEIICDSETERQKYEEAVIAITVEQSLRRLGSYAFLLCFDAWTELLLLTYS